MFWHPTQPKIEGWFDLKLREFAVAENQNPKLLTGHWLDRYIHDGPHEWFFCEFPVLLQEWLAKFTKKKTNFQGGEPTSWTPELIQELQETNNKASWAVEVWLDSILEGYIIEFEVAPISPLAKQKGSSSVDLKEDSYYRYNYPLRNWSVKKVF